MSKPTSIRDVINSYPKLDIKGNNNNVGNVNVNNNINNNVYVNNKDKLISQLIDECGGETNAIANNIAEKLNDLRSLNYFLKMARTHPPQILFESLAETMLADREGRIRSYPAKYFVGVLKKKVKFLKMKGKYAKK
ncbi:MAG: hypothetical protein H6774_03065 [Pseudomonadales bacterium]|nr:hypothetical protein [Pseudomonadales bacterium]